MAALLGHRSSNTSQSGTINSRIPLDPPTQRQISSSINLLLTPFLNQASALIMLDNQLEIKAVDDLCNFTYNEVADATVGFNIIDDSNFFKSNVNQSVLQGTCENTPRAKNGVAENSFHLSKVEENDVNASKYLAVPTDLCLRSVETQTDKESCYAKQESLVIDLQSKLSTSEAYLVDQSSWKDHDMKNDSKILEESTRCTTNGKDRMTETVGSDEDSPLVSIDEKIKTWLEDLNTWPAHKNDTKLQALKDIHSNKEATLDFQYKQRIQELNFEVQRTKSELEMIKERDEGQQFLRLNNKHGGGQL
ncbi:hypothetical protein PPACK8108_LOCUS16668 [Phakopsora pachyrhizi]|uniref:Uncharacterized protein n=1 Tax=Phakopsora pachyrhizi TaxID=170000 RepID=A0AAV0BAS5_PHAPC|nr:hypothetical protein PPACK8108_LOCUS16668 [Phakopsora pachyrhizi]